MVLEQCCESWRTAKQTQSASIDTSNSATAMPNPNFPSSNHRAQFIPTRDSRNRAAITRSFGLTWVTGRKPRADFRFGMAIINRAHFISRPRRSRSSGTNGARITFPAPDANLHLQITSRPILRKQKYSARGLARWKMNARQPSAGTIISATCEWIKSLRPRNRLFAHPQRSRAF
jgi:hypothetical protein